MGWRMRRDEELGRHCRRLQRGVEVQIGIGVGDGQTWS